MTDRIEKTTSLKSSIDAVWEAITDHEKFGAWFRVKLYQPFREGEITKGHITHPEAEGMQWESLTKTIGPKSYFSMIWYHDDVEPDASHPGRAETLVEFKLRPEGTGTHLTIIESGFDSFPPPRGEENRRRNEGGWAEQINNIKAFTDG